MESAGLLGDPRGVCRKVEVVDSNSESALEVAHARLERCAILFDRLYAGMVAGLPCFCS